MLLERRKNMFSEYVARQDRFALGLAWQFMMAMGTCCMPLYTNGRMILFSDAHCYTVD